MSCPIALHTLADIATIHNGDSFMSNYSSSLSHSYGDNRRHSADYQIAMRPIKKRVVTTANGIDSLGDTTSPLESCTALDQPLDNKPKELSLLSTITSKPTKRNSLKSDSGPTFPVILMGMLSSPQNSGIITFLSDQQRFIIINPIEFEKKVLTMYFKDKTTKVTTHEKFVKMLINWGFEIVKDLKYPDINVYRHHMFRNGDWEECFRIIKPGKSSIQPREFFAARHQSEPSLQTPKIKNPHLSPLGNASFEIPSECHLVAPPPQLFSHMSVSDLSDISKSLKASLLKKMANTQTSRQLSGIGLMRGQLAVRNNIPTDLESTLFNHHDRNNTSTFLPSSFGNSSLFDYEWNFNSVMLHQLEEDFQQKEHKISVETQPKNCYGSPTDIRPTSVPSVRMETDEINSSLSMSPRPSEMNGAMNTSIPTKFPRRHTIDSIPQGIASSNSKDIHTFADPIPTTNLDLMTQIFLKKSMARLRSHPIGLVVASDTHSSACVNNGTFDSWAGLRSKNDCYRSDEKFKIDAGAQVMEKQQ